MKRKNTLLNLLLILKSLKLTLTAPSYTLLEGYKDFKSYYSNKKEFIIENRDIQLKELLKQETGFNAEKSQEIVSLFNYSNIKFIQTDIILYYNGIINSFSDLYTKVFFISVYKLITKFMLQLFTFFDLEIDFKKSVSRVLSDLLKLDCCNNQSKIMVYKFIKHIGYEYLCHPIKDDLFISKISSVNNCQYKDLLEEYKIYLKEIYSVYNKKSNLVNYFSGPLAILIRNNIRSFLLKFSKHFCLKILKSSEFIPILTILPEFNLLNTVLQNNSIFLKTFNRTHNFLSITLMKYRFIVFLLFGKKNNLLKQKFLLRYKIMIIKKLKMTLRSYFLVLLNYFTTKDIYRIKKYLKFIQIVSIKCFLGLNDERLVFDEIEIQKNFHRYYIYDTVVNDLIKN